MKKLGFGLMRPPMIGEEVDMAQMCQMVDSFIAAGFNYFDTAPTYMGGKNEELMRDAVVKRYPREEIILASKLPLWYAEEKNLSMQEIWDQSMERTQAGYYDYYLLHAMNKKWIEAADRVGAWQFMQDKKAKGLVRKIGFSFHDTPEVLEQILSSHPEMEFVQLQINYADWNSEKVRAGECYEVARKYNKPIIVMEPVKGGTLASLSPVMEEVFSQVNPEASVASWALRFVAEKEGIQTVLSGMSTIEQVQDNIKVLDEVQPFTEEERAAVVKVQNMIATAPQVACTACSYCTEECPMNINIPRLFRAYNYFLNYGNRQIAGEIYDSAIKERGKACECIGCGNCESHCPQQLSIRNILKKIADVFEEINC